MKYKFIVEYVSKDKPIGIFVRQKEKHNFVLGDNPTLNGCPIKKSVTQPRSLKEDGNPDFDVFFFHLENGKDSDKFTKGKTVELQT